MAVIRGLMVGFWLVFNTTAVSLLILLCAPLKLAARTPWLDQKISRFFNELQQFWTTLNSVVYRWGLPTRWQVAGLAPLKKEGWYFVVANHQSWVDILVIYEVLRGHVPVGKFFIKHTLMYVPIVGLAVKALDFPFMKRHSAAYLARHPEKRGEDLATTRHACARYALQPVTVINFLEGTRANPEKRRAQGSPYRHLLRPKSAGAAFVLAALGERMDCLLDLTLVYPQGVPSFWDFCCGRVPAVCVDIRIRPIAPELCAGRYEEDAEFRQAFQHWVNTIWHDKDLLIEQMNTPVRNS